MSKVLLIVNPSSGGEKAKSYEDLAREKLAECFDEVVVKHTEKGGDAAAFAKELYARIAQRLLQSVDYIPNEYLFLMRDALLTIPGIECERKEFIYTKDTLNKLNIIMELTEDYQKKPLIRMLEGEYELFVHKDEKKAQQYYEEGLTLARLLGHTFLSKKMAEEWNKELQIYHQG